MRLPSHGLVQARRPSAVDWPQRLLPGAYVPPLHDAGMVHDPVLEAVRVFAGISLQVFGPSSAFFVQISERR